jgi:hypothetical protein
VIYRLPEVLKAKSVLVCEGEKDCETARKLDLVATCNPAGAGKWRDEYSQFLRSKRVAIIADADSPGRKHAGEVASSLYGKVASIKLLELHGSKDLTDWVNSNGTRGTLIALIRNAPEWTAQRGSPTANSPARQSHPKIKEWDQIPTVADVPNVPIQWLVGNLIPQGSFTHFFGEPGHFKTWLAMAIAKAVATGQPFAGLPANRTEVLYLDRENPPCVIRERANHLQLLNVPLKYWALFTAEEPPSTGDRRLLTFAAERKPLLIFDALVRFHSGDENKSNEMKPIMENFRALVNAGATVLCLHHRSGKSDSNYRGSSEILAACDLAYEIRRRELPSATINVRCIKNRFDLERGFAFELKPGGFVQVATDSESETAEAVQIVARIIKSSAPIKQSDVVRAVQEKGIAKQQCLDLLEENPQNLWRWEHGPKNSKLFYPCEAVDSEPREYSASWQEEII